MIDVLKTIGTAFVATVISDVVIVIYTRAIADQNVKIAVIMAMMIALTRGVSLILLTNQPTPARKWLCQLGVVFGMGCGTYIGLTLCARM
jgi:hypothetical protein